MIPRLWMLLVLLLLVLAAPAESMRDEAPANVAAIDASFCDEEPVAVAPVIDAESRVATPAPLDREDRAAPAPTRGRIFRPPRTTGEPSNA